MLSGMSAAATSVKFASLALQHSAHPTAVGNNKRSPAVMLPDPTAADYMGHSHDPHSYDYLDYDEVDTSAGYADDHMYGAHAAATNYTHRNTVTMDVTKSHYRSMNHDSNKEAVKFIPLQVDSSKTSERSTITTATATTATTTTATGLTESCFYSKKQTVNDSKYSKYLESESESVSTSCQLAAMLGSLSKEDLSSILYLCMACICEHLSSCSTSAKMTSEQQSFDKIRYLALLLKSNQEFLSVLQEITTTETEIMNNSHNTLPVNSFGSFRSKDIKLYANQLISVL
jgi:hypothetical protein